MVLFIVGGVCLLAVLAVVGLGVLALIFMVIGTYNSLIQLRNNVDKEWSNIDVLLKRRYDLIPNLIETVKGYAKHERKTFTEVTKYRGMIASGSPQERMQANDLLTGALSKLMMVAENYPKLQANQNFMHLQQELANTENGIATGRTNYNNATITYRNKRQVFPNNIVAGAFGSVFPEKQLFEVKDASVRKAPKVSFE